MTTAEQILNEKTAERIQQRFAALAPFLDEKQRRLLAGAEAKTYGPGGIEKVAHLLGIAENTVRRGLRELHDPGAVERERVRRPGGGRKPTAAIDPTLLSDLEALVAPQTRGDPCSPLGWTSKSTRKLAAELSQKGHAVSPRLVAHLLHQLGYSLQANRKLLEGTQQHPDRGAQFRHINATAQDYQERQVSRPPVVQAKISIPSPGGSFRPMAAALAALAGEPIVLVSAPAGFGKTSTAAAWAQSEERRGARVAWLRCDRTDADLDVFAHHIASALSRSLRGPALPEIPAAGTPEAIANRLAALIERTGWPVRLVLDDVHTLPADSPVWPALTALGESLPPNLRLVLLSRDEHPPLPLLRWQSQQRLARCSSEQLRLADAAVAAVLAERLNAAPPHVVSRAIQLTGGWPILVALLAERLAQIPSATWQQALAGVPGLDMVAEYFGSEVLGAMDDRERRFLLITSVAHVLDAQAVAAIWPDRDGPRLLERFTRSPFFTALDAAGARLQHHALFEAFLQGEAERDLGTEALHRVQATLAHHADAAGDPERALQYALEAGEWALAAGILARMAYALQTAGSLRALAAPLGRLPERVRESNPYALLVAAHLAASRGEAGTAIALAGQGLDGVLAAGDANAAAAAIAHLSDALPGSEAARAIAARLTSHPNARIAAWASLWALKLDIGRIRPAAIQTVLRRLEAHEPSADLLDEARLTAGWLFYMTGDLAEVHFTPRAYVRAVARQRFDPFPAYLYAGRWDELADLVAAAREVEPPAWAAGHVRAWLNIPEAVLALVHGRIDQAESLLLALEHAYGPADGGFVRPEFLSVYRAVRAGHALRAGRGPEALRLLRDNLLLHTGDPVMRPVSHLDLAQAHAVLGDLAAARQELHAARELAEDEGLRGLYYRLLETAIGAGSPWPLLEEVERLGAFGFLPLYDPGPLRRALEAARSASQVPARLRASAERVLDLFERGQPQSVDPPAPPLVIRSLGGFATERGGQRLRSPGPRVAELLLRLADAGGRPVPRAELAEAMWPEAPRDAQTNRMRVTLHTLRRWLADLGCGERLLTTRTKVLIQAGDWLEWDVTAWRRGVQAARREPCLRACLHTLDLYRGPLLPEADFHEAFYYEREQCAREQSETARLAASLTPDPGQAVAILEAACRLNPTDEALVAALIHRLVEGGKRDRAQAVAAAWSRDTGGPLPEGLDALVRGASRPSP